MLAMSFVSKDILSVAGIPDLDGLVIACRGQVFPIRRPCNCCHAAAMTHAYIPHVRLGNNSRLCGAAGCPRNVWYTRYRSCPRRLIGVWYAILQWKRYPIFKRDAL